MCSTREYLAELFWGDSDRQRARHALNTALWRLQGVLDGDTQRRNTYLLVDSQSIGFNRHSDVALDIADFEDRCTLADQLGSQSADQQATLYR
jgi:DNA-binding SARP family transcriptional activator